MRPSPTRSWCPRAVAAALRVPEQPGRPLLGALVAAVGSRGVLLVLDNCEHLLDACATLAAGLLGACPVLRVLATSREPLAVAGEAVWPVPPLALPPAAASRPSARRPARWRDSPSPPPAQEGAGWPAPGRCASSSTVPRGGAGFALTAGNAGAVAEVCRRLDGLPLALELAAPRVRGLGVVALAARLGAHFDRLDLLAGGRGPGPPRQRTLRATLDWSYDLLSPAEQALFARLAVFAGGFDLAAAEAVGRGAEPAAEGDAGPADLLVRLVDRSLVATESPAPPAPPAPPGSAADGGPAGVRYRLLETVREYAAERLADEGHAAAAAVRRRHAEHYAALAERAEPALRWSGQASWVARLEREHDNARAALGWALDAATADTQVPRTARDAAALALRLAVAYGAFWQLRGYLAEGRRWLEAALAADLAAGAGGAAPPGLALRAHATFWLGLLSWLGGDLPAGRARLEESVARLRAQNAPVGLGLALSHLGQLALAQGDAAGAQRLTEEAVALLRRRGDAWELGVALTHLGDVADEQGDAAGARRLYDESAALLRRAGDATMLALPAGVVGPARRRRGRLRGRSRPIRGGPGGRPGGRPPGLRRDRPAGPGRPGAPGRGRRAGGGAVRRRPGPPAAHGARPGRGARDSRGWPPSPSCGATRPGQRGCWRRGGAARGRRGRPDAADARPTTRRPGGPRRPGGRGHRGIPPWARR